jgi:ParB family transcriptional regulator, chromosome partitioning protein
MSSKKRTGLGRGIAALIPDADVDMGPSDTGYPECPVDQISPNPYQPRVSFPDEELEGLAESIREQGILQPLLVRRMGETFQLIAGERRLRAAREAGLSHVPVIIRDLTDEQVLEVSIIENIQRQNLNVLEEADAYFRLIQEFKYTQEVVARKVGKSRPAIANLLRLRGLPERIKQGLRQEQLTMGHARAILGAGSEENQLALFDLVVQRGLSVRETERLAGRGTLPPPPPPEPKPVTEKMLLEETTRRISFHLNSPVRIRKEGDRGRIEIRFTSSGEFDRLVDLLSRNP